MKRKNSVRRLLIAFLTVFCVVYSQNLYSQYCPATNTDCNFEYVTNVTLSNINNNSACDAPYDDFTAQVGDMMRGVTYNGTITKNGNIATYLATIFIDWNKNGIFDLTGEDFPGTLNATQTGFTFSIATPAGALLGATRMRVRMVQTTQPTACGTFGRGDVEDYTINVIPVGPPSNNTCATATTLTPNGSCVVTNGTTTNATQQYPPTACSGNTAANANDVWYSFTADGVKNYTINTTGLGGFNPVLAFYNNCGTPAPVSCVDATSINGTETINVGVLPAGTYYYRVYGNGGNGNFSTCVTFPGGLTYCTATNTDCAFEYITNVTLITINNNSLCDAPYDDFTAQSTTVALGQTYNGTISKSGNVATYLASVYIDWNQNGVFDLPSEEITANPNAATTGFDFSVSPPAGALLGNTRMRIRMTQFSNTPAPCGPTTRGDIEDYTLTVTNIVVPPNDDCANAITVNPTTGCTLTNGFTTNGNQQYPPTNCSGTTTPTANEVWYKFTADGTSIYQIQTTGTGGFNPVLGLYTACGAANLVICKDTSGVNQTEIINAGILAAGTYYYRIYGNGGDGTFSTCVQVTSTTGLNYCTASNTDCGFEYITFVGLTTIGNTSDCGDPYDNYTSQIAYIRPGQTYTGHIKKSDILTNYTCSVFIDWNQNGTFDLTETINATATGTSTFSFTVMPPITAVLGSTRMRVRMVQNDVPTACGAIGRGDIEDYTVNLSNTPAPVPANDDCSGAIPITPTTSCGSHGGGSTIGATQQFPPQLCDGSTAASANEVWFSFQANGTSGYQITINPDPNFDPVISLYNACAAGNRIDCEDLQGVGLIENMFTGVLPAGTYYYRIHGKGAAGTFAHCIKELLPQDEYGCATAKVLCSKDPISESAVLGYGLDGAESYGSCLAAGVGLDANTEENSKWYKWTADNNGVLTFDIVPRDTGFPTTDSLDVDFVLYELDPNLGCAGKIQLRCMASSCKGLTGLNTTSVDVTELPDCLPGDDNYVQALTQTAGKVYALMINNFDLPSRGYDLYFGGTATFRGPKPEI
ncbi:MAG: hypothetical protein KJ941_00350, partial [Bacteroidetes bacterium]|nr:hypothetical protein [Bacteroidota bacterium]